MAMSKSMVSLEISVSITLTRLCKVESLQVFISRNQIRQTVRITFACLFVCRYCCCFLFFLFFLPKNRKGEINSLKLGMSVSESLEETFSSAIKYLSWNSTVGSDQLRGGPL